MRPFASLVAALLAIACSSPTRTGAPAPVAAGVDGVTLLEAGAEPREILRELPGSAGSETRSLSLAITGEQIQGNFTGLTAAPLVLLELELRRSVPSDGSMAVSFSSGPFTLGSTELVAPKVIASMEASLDGTSGHAGRAEVDRSGAVDGLHVELADPENVQVQQLAASYAQSLALVALRFPGEAVGVGARWSWASSHRQTLGVLIEQENTASLLANAQGRLRVRMESVLTAGRQRLSGAPLPEGQSLDVTSVSGEGSGELILATGQLLPVEIDSRGHWDLRLIADQTGAADEVTLTQDMTLSLTSDSGD